MDKLREVIPGVYEVEEFSEEECSAILDLLRSTDEWDQAKLAIAGTRQVVETKRKQRIIQRKDCSGRLLEFAHEYTNRMLPYMKVFPSWVPDIRIDLCQYQATDPGGYFRWHSDQRPDKMRIGVALLYLSDERHGLIGGQTEFDIDGKITSVYPRLGKVVMFDPPLRHRGADVVSGCKYGLIATFTNNAAGLDAVEKFD